MDDQNTLPRELTEEEKKNPVSSGAVEWHDPLDKPEQEPDRPTGKLATASVLLGAAGICMSCAAPAAALLGAAGLVCGILSHVRHENAKGLRTAGIILSAAALGIALILFIMRFILESGGAGVTDYYQGVEDSAGI